MAAQIKDPAPGVSDHRGRKIIESIDACGNQFVNADTGLIASLMLPLDVMMEHLCTAEIGFNDTTHYTELGSVRAVDDLCHQFVVVYNGSDDMKRKLFAKHRDFYTRI